MRFLITPMLAAWAIGCGSEEIDPMEVQPKLDPYEHTSLFRDGMAMRTPPPGTVPRERMVTDPAVTTGESKGVPVDSIPIPVTLSLVQTGRVHFDIYCAPCHGLLGDGRSIVAAQMSLRPPPSLQEEPALTMPAGRIYQVVTSGYGLMAGYSEALPVEARWGVVAYLRALQLSRHAGIDAAPPAERLRLREETR